MPTLAAEGPGARVAAPAAPLQSILLPREAAQMAPHAAAPLRWLQGAARPAAAAAALWWWWGLRLRECRLRLLQQKVLLLLLLL